MYMFRYEVLIELILVQNIMPIIYERTAELKTENMSEILCSGSRLLCGWSPLNKIHNRITDSVLNTVLLPSVFASVALNVFWLCLKKFVYSEFGYGKCGNLLEESSQQTCAQHYFFTCRRIERKELQKPFFFVSQGHFSNIGTTSGKQI